MGRFSSGQIPAAAVIAPALALALATESAVLREGHIEHVLTGVFVDRARAFQGHPRCECCACGPLCRNARAPVEKTQRSDW